jgi:hypothetical protein
MTGLQPAAMRRRQYDGDHRPDGTGQLRFPVSRPSSAPRDEAAPQSPQIPAALLRQGLPQAGQPGPPPSRPTRKP